MSARAALGILLDEFQPRRLYLPSFLCPALVATAQGRGVPVRFYPVGEELTPEVGGSEGIAPGDLFLAIDYFGWPADDTLLRAARSAGAVVVVDAAQALLSQGVEERADWTILSPRKFVGIVDGGVLVGKAPLRCRELPPPPALWWQEAFAATLLRRDFDTGSPANGWFECFRTAEAGVPEEACRMSDLSRTLLLGSTFDWQEIASRRRDNYRILARTLSDLALFPELPAGVVPLGFPLRVDRRDERRQRLFEHRIYPPIHWQLGDSVPGDFRQAHRLAESIMTIPCDQRYNADDMERVASVLMRELA